MSLWDLDARLSVDESGNITEVGFFRNPEARHGTITDRDFAMAMTIGTLQSVDIFSTDISDDLIDANAQNLVELKHIHPPKRVGSRGVRACCKFPRLEKLDLSFCPQVLDEFLADAKMLGQVSFISVLGTDTDGKFLAHMPDDNKLTCLQMAETRFSDVYIRELNKLSHLDTLDISSTQVTESGLRSLACTKLRTLYLRNIAISHASIAAALSNVPALEEVFVTFEPSADIDTPFVVCPNHDGPRKGNPYSF